MLILVKLLVDDYLRQICSLVADVVLFDARPPLGAELRIVRLADQMRRTSRRNAEETRSRVTAAADGRLPMLTLLI